MNVTNKSVKVLPANVKCKFLHILVAQYLVRRAQCLKQISNETEQAVN